MRLSWYGVVLNRERRNMAGQIGAGENETEEGIWKTLVDTGRHYSLVGNSFVSHNRQNYSSYHELEDEFGTFYLRGKSPSYLSGSNRLE